MRLLYVDDDRINTMLFAETCRFAKQGLVVETAHSGGEALETVARWRPEVLVIDLHLPDGSGCELLQRLRTVLCSPAMPAFLCTADDIRMVGAAAHAAGFTACWSKPVDLPAMLQDLAALGAAESR